MLVLWINFVQNIWTKTLFRYYYDNMLFLKNRYITICNNINADFRQIGAELLELRVVGSFVHTNAQVRSSKVISQLQPDS
jgi:hypothetical protein